MFEAGCSEGLSLSKTHRNGDGWGWGGCDVSHLGHFDFVGPRGIQIKIQKPRAGKTLLMEDKDRVKMQMALMFSPSTLFPKGSFPSLNSLSLLVPHN